MEDDAIRLQRCFSKVFPALSPDEIYRARIENVLAWDSLASIMLLTLIGEEFHLTMDMDQIEQFPSYESLLKHIMARGAHA